NRVLYSHINKIIKFFNLRIVIYDPNSPFNTERTIFDCEKILLPLKIGVLKNEMFACIDDDNCIPNSCLAKRGLYPTTLVNNPELKNNTSTKITSRELVLMKDKTIELLYYPNSQRVHPLPIRTISILSGTVKVCIKNECYTLSHGEKLNSYANISHKITALTDSKINCSLYNV
ncbi:MAG: hypothetical protein WCT36_01495, partial [Candidatus Gracilibacteria bacterium]